MTKNNKWLSVIIAFILCLPLYAWNGSGTYEDPYEINTASDVADLATAVNGGASQSGVYFLQTADVDLSSFGNFTPIGSASAPFAGNYDGNGYILSNLTITASVSGATTNAFGFFGYCENPTLENMSVYGSVKISAEYNANACVGVGGVVGIVVKGLFASLHNYCDIDVKISGASANYSSQNNIKYGVGGVIGFNAQTTNAGTQHIGCENYGNIYVDGVNGACAIGGCFSANVPQEGTTTSFVGFNNYGKIIVNGRAESAYAYCSIVGGIGSFHHTSNGSRTPQINNCSNFGNILCSNSVHEAGILAKGTSGGSYCRANYSTNYAEIAIATGGTGRIFVAGILTSCDGSYDSTVRNCVNFGKIIGKGEATCVCQLGGIASALCGLLASAGSSYENKNFGDIEANCPNATSVVIGGIATGERKVYLKRSENHGNISVNTGGSVLLGGVASVSSQGNTITTISDCISLGNITATGNSNTNYSPCVGGIFAQSRITGSNTRNIILSNCYNLGQAKLNLNSADCYGAIYGVANTHGNYSVSIKNCYAIVGEGQNLIGAVDASNGNVSLENCVGIKSGREGGIAYSVVGSNNWSQTGTQIVSYEDCYTDTYKCLGNISSGLFFPAEKSTNYFDLILPINTALYSTPSAEDKNNHNYTKAQGYKRYIRTIQQ